MCHRAKPLRKGGLSRQSSVDTCVTGPGPLQALASQVIKAQQLQGMKVCLTGLTPASR